MSSFRAFIAGFLTLAVLHVCVTCSEDDSGTQPTTEPTVNVDKIHEAAQRVEDAFRTGIPDSVRSVLTEEAGEQYAAFLPEITGEMPTFADVISSRRLVSYTSCYAEYAYDVEGRTLSFAMAGQDEDDWKLMRF